MIRLQLGSPNNTLVTPEVYNQLFTMHGTTMVFLFVVPMMAGLANYFLPLMIGARDMAFPRLNALSFWLLLAGGLVFYSSLFWNPARSGLDERRAAGQLDLLPQRRRGRLDLPDPPDRPLLDPRRDQLLRDDRQHARPRDELGPAAAVRLDDPDLLGPADLRPAGDRRGGDDAADRPPFRDALLRLDRGRLGDPLAAPLLVLRPPRGLHHGAARFRHHLGDPARLRPQADLRLQGDRGIDRGDRLPGLPDLGAPHVHGAHPRGDPGVRDAQLLLHRRPHGSQDPQLGRHALARDDRIQDAADLLCRRESRSS